MADFAAVLKKTIDAQDNPDQALRQRVYAKARSTIEQKLAAANAPDAVAQRQRQMLETSIEEIEAEYRAAERAAEEAAQPEQVSDPLEDFLKAVQDAGVADEQSADTAASVLADDPHDTADGISNGWQNERGTGLGFDDRPSPGDPDYGNQSYDDHDDDDEPRSGRSKGLIVGLIALLALGGAGYAGWTYQDQIKNYVTSLTSGTTDSGEGTDAGEDADDDADGTTAPEAQTPPAATGETTGNAAPTTPPTTPPAETKPAGDPKLTQRLLPDGNEVDAGAAGEAPKIGEGTSTAPATSGTPAPATSGATQSQTIPVGQRAFFYEEQRTGETSAAVKGNVVWSVVQDSPGEGAPDEPAIRADASFPDAKVSLRMTIRRNADQSIPASHLIEMIYTVPDDFSGGVIENVQRVTFKDSEQAAGNPLAAIPMKIADNFFLVALNDARTAVDMNLSLMRRQQWIDIPITYRNGRRALISMEKGVPGNKVFDEVLKDWGTAAPAAN